MTKNSAKGFPINRLHYFILIAIDYLFFFVIQKQYGDLEHLDIVLYSFFAFLAAEALISLGRIHDITSKQWVATLKGFIPFLIIFSTLIVMFFNTTGLLCDGSLVTSQLLILILFFIPSNLIKRS